MAPESTLEEKSNSSILSNFPSESGIDPSNKFLDRFRSIIICNSPNEAGMCSLPRVIHSARPKVLPRSTAAGRPRRRRGTCKPVVFWLVQYGGDFGSVCHRSYRLQEELYTVLCAHKGHNVTQYTNEDPYSRGFSRTAANKFPGYKVRYQT